MNMTAPLFSPIEDIANCAPGSGSVQAGAERAEKARQTKIGEYSRLADNAMALAEASVLDNVREKHELAAARWRDLALLTERPPAQKG